MKLMLEKNRNVKLCLINSFKIKMFSAASQMRIAQISNIKYQMSNVKCNT